MYNYLALTIATVSSFALGGLWYSFLFGKIWQNATGISDEQIKNHGMMPYVVSIVCSLLAAIGFNYLVMNSVSLEHNIFMGLLVGMFVATAMFINAQFCERSNKVFLINAGYHVTRFVIYALVFWFVK